MNIFSVETGLEVAHTYQTFCQIKRNKNIFGKPVHGPSLAIIRPLAIYCWVTFILYYSKGIWPNGITQLLISAFYSSMFIYPVWKCTVKSRLISKWRCHSKLVLGHYCKPNSFEKVETLGMFGFEFSVHHIFSPLGPYANTKCPLNFHLCIAWTKCLTVLENLYVSKVRKMSCATGTLLKDKDRWEGIFFSLNSSRCWLNVIFVDE